MQEERDGLGKQRTPSARIMGMDTPAQNSYVIDARSGAEMARLLEQDRMVTQVMGSLLPPGLEHGQIQAVLDVACGPGGWAQEVAFHFPEVQVIGIDTSQRMIAYARAFARVQRLENAHFRVMDATRPLAFPDATFDLVNARFLMGFLTLRLWPSVVRELVRVTRPGGLVRLTECDDWGQTNSVALETLRKLAARAFVLTGRGFPPLPDGQDGRITAMLEYFLQEAGCDPIQHATHVLDFSADAPTHKSQYDNLKVALYLLQPFLVQSGVATGEELEHWIEQALFEMYEQTFRGLWHIVSACGWKSLEKHNSYDYPLQPQLPSGKSGGSTKTCRITDSKSIRVPISERNRWDGAIKAEQSRAEQAEGANNGDQRNGAAHP